MGEIADLELLVRSRIPIILVETHEEGRAVDLFKRLALRLAVPAFAWTVTEGLRRVDLDLGSQAHNAEPGAVLRHIKALDSGGVFLLLDFHPYLGEPVHVRLLKEIARPPVHGGHGGADRPRAVHAAGPAHAERALRAVAPAGRAAHHPGPAGGD